MPTLSASIRLMDNMSPALKSMSSAMNAVVQNVNKIAKATNSLSPAELSRMNSAVKNLDVQTARMTKSASSASEELKGMGKASKDGAQSLEGLAGKVTALVGAYAGLQGVKSLINMADEVSSVNSRLSLMTGSLEETDSLNAKIRQSANNARGSYTDMADLVSKLGLMAGSAFTGGNDQIVQFAEQVSKLGALGGSSTQEMSAGMLQLEQALASGTLRGDELNSVMEQMPYFAQTLAKGLGVTTGQLRTMGSEGQLTADQVVTAIMGMSSQTDQAFQGTATTFGQVWNLFKNNAQEAITPVLSELSKLANNPEFQAGMAQMGQSISQLIPLIVPVVKNVAEIITKVASFSGLIPTIMGVVGAFAAYQAIMTAVKVATVIFNGIQLIGAGIKAAYTGATLAETSATAAATASQWGLNAAMLASPVTWVVIGVVALIAVLVLLFSHWDQVTQIAQNCWNVIYNGAIWAWNGVLQAFSPVLDELKAGWNNFQQTFGPGWDAFRGACETAMSNTQTAASAGMGILKGLMDNDQQAVMDNAKVIWDMLPAGVQDGLIGAYNAVTGWWDGVNTFFATLPEKMKQWGYDFINNLTGGMLDKLPDIGTAAQSVADKIAGFLHFSTPDEGPLASVESWMPDMITTITTGLQNGVSAVQGAVDLVAGAIKTALTGVFNIDLSGVTAQLQLQLNGMLVVTAAAYAQMQAQATANNTTMAQQTGAAYAGMATAATAQVVAMSAAIQLQIAAMRASFSGIFTGIATATIAAMTLLATQTAVVITGLAMRSEAEISGMGTAVIAHFNAMSAATVAAAAGMAAGITATILAMDVAVIAAMTAFRAASAGIWSAIRANAISSTSSMSITVLAILAAFVSSVKTQLNVLPPFMTGVATGMMSAMASGITSSQATVVNTTSALVEQIKSVFIAGLGIHSPAVFGFFVGSMLAAGIINGLSSGQIGLFTAGIIQNMKDSFTSGQFNATDLVNYLDEDTLKLVTRLQQDGDTTTGQAASSIAYPLIGDAGTISSYFGYRNDTGDVGSTNHQGLDIAAATGTPVASILGGTVTLAGEYGGYGNAVIVDHGGGIQSLYGHMSAINTSVGSTVAAGQQIGAVGSTGWSTGPHLHLSVIKDGAMVDPLPYIQGAPLAAGNTLVSAIMAAYNLKKGITGGNTYGMVGNWMGGEGADVASAAITQALALLGLPQSYLSGLMWAAYNESGYNPNAVNNWDSNAAAGDPSRGLFQTIGSTFSAYQYPGHGNIWNPLDNALAAIRYMISRYGSVDAVINPRMGGWYGYASGTNYASSGAHWVGENGPELMFMNGGEGILNAQRSVSLLREYSGILMNLPTGYREPVGRTGLSASRSSQRGSVNVGDIHVTVELNGTTDADLNDLGTRVGKVLRDEIYNNPDGLYA